MSDLVQRLRDWAKVVEGIGGLSRTVVMNEAADRIESLERQLAEANAREARDYSELLDEFNKVKAQNVQLLNRLAEAQGKVAGLTDDEIRVIYATEIGIRAKSDDISFARAVLAAARSASSDTAPSPAAADKTNCSHPKTVMQSTGDGSEVEFCPDCGRNVATRFTAQGERE